MINTTRTEAILARDWRFALTASPDEHPTDDAWRTVDLPHDWVINRPVSPDAPWGACMAFRQWEGVGWYAKTVTLPVKGHGRRYWLDFDGVQECATVYVNGCRVGYQGYGYTPFRLEVTDAVREGCNEILVRADFTQSPTDRWYSGAGIVRTARWIETPARCLDERDVVVRQHVDPELRRASLSVDPGLPGPAAIQLRDDGDAVVALARRDDGDDPLDITVPDAHLWSAEHPYLYKLTVSLPDSGDAVSMRLGLRDVAFDADRGMLVNGVKTIFKGVCLHQDIAPVGAAATPELWRARLEYLKRMGCNGLRLAHHMFAREFLDLADAMGFYVYSEPFDKWRSGHYLRFFETDWRHDLDAMFRRDRNRPSVVMWGVGNEVEDQGKWPMVATLRQLVDEAHRMDPTRPIGCAMNPHFQYDDADYGDRNDMDTVFNEAPKTGEITDPAERVEHIKRIADVTDVIVMNYAEQWYGRVREAVPGKPIFGSETYQWFMGHDEQLQNFTQDNPQLVPWRNDRQWVIGGAIWSGYDYLGESMGWPSKGWSAAPLRTNGVERFSFDLLRSYWTDEPMVSFAVLDYSLPDEMVKEHWDMPPYVRHWDFSQFRRALIPYAIASNCEEVRVYVNGKRFYVPSPAQCPNRLITGYLPWAPGEVVVEGLNNGTVACRDVVRTPGRAAQLVWWTDSPSALPARRGYCVALTACVADDDGNEVFRAEPEVGFSVSGPASIVAVDNGDLTNDEPYDGHTVTAHQGKASVFLRLNGQAGRVEITAKSNNFNDSRWEISVNTNC
ncbi:sugar-binding domain-containing protein [Bifidobacterium avesanii]|nr:sugar-binding domain-containing protein [Bifidobacterium avesanii]KAB8295629.1 glycoside hydrolase family 2 [Bifidobacterium avesanii]